MRSSTYSFRKLSLTILIISLTASISIAQAGAVDTAKEYANKAMFWKDEHLSEITFQELYPKAFYKKSYFSGVILGVSVVAGVAVAYFSVGAGAPVAATGVSTVASWIAGGGAGSYMAGLSTIGGWVGGNAITGAIILNGLSYGLIGGTMGKFATLSATAKFGVFANISATMMDGVAIIKNPDTGKLHYTVRLKLPKNLGGKQVRALVDDIYHNEENIEEAINDGDMFKAERYASIKKSNLLHGEELLSRIVLNSSPSQEDLLVLSMLSYTNGNTNLFTNTVDELSKFEEALDNPGFLYYLNAINSLLDRDIEGASFYLDSSIKQMPYALEPVVLYINILGDNLSKNESKILGLLKYMEENYDSDKYSSSYSLLAPYFRVATIYYNDNNYQKAKHFYEKATSEIGYIQLLFGSGDIGNQVKLGIANSCYQIGEKDKADELYDEVIEGLEGDSLKAMQQQYAGNASS